MRRIIICTAEAWLIGSVQHHAEHAGRFGVTEASICKASAVSSGELARCAELAMLLMQPVTLYF